MSDDGLFPRPGKASKATKGSSTPNSSGWTVNPDTAQKMGKEFAGQWEKPSIIRTIIDKLGGGLKGRQKMAEIYKRETGVKHKSAMNRVRSWFSGETSKPKNAAAVQAGYAAGLTSGGGGIHVSFNLVAMISSDERDFGSLSATLDASQAELFATAIGTSDWNMALAAAFEQYWPGGSGALGEIISFDNLTIE